MRNKAMSQPKSPDNDQTSLLAAERASENPMAYLGSSRNQRVIEQLYEELKDSLEQNDQTYFGIAGSMSPLDTAYFIVQQACRDGVVAQLRSFAFQQGHPLALKQNFEHYETDRIFWLHVIGFLSNLAPTASESQALNHQIERLFHGPSETANDSLPINIEKYLPIHINSKSYKNKIAGKNKKITQSLQYQLYLHLLAYTDPLGGLSLSRDPDNRSVLRWNDLIQFYSFDQQQAIAFFFHTLPRLATDFKYIGISEIERSHLELEVVLMRRFFELSEYSYSLTVPYLSSYFFTLPELKGQDKYSTSIQLFQEGKGLRRLKKRATDERQKYFEDYKKEKDKRVDQTKKQTHQSPESEQSSRINLLKTVIENKVKRLFKNYIKETKLYLDKSFVFIRNHQQAFEILVHSAQESHQSHQAELENFFKSKNDSLKTKLFKNQTFQTLWFSDGEIVFYFLVFVFKALASQTLPADAEASLPVLTDQPELAIFEMKNFKDIFSIVGWFGTDAQPTARFWQFLDFLELIFSQEIRRLQSEADQVFLNGSECERLSQHMHQALTRLETVSVQTVSDAFLVMLKIPEVSQTLAQVSAEDFNYPHFMLEIALNTGNSQARVHFLHPFGIDFIDENTLPNGFLTGSLAYASDTCLMPFVRQIYGSYLQPLLQISVDLVVDLLLVNLVKEAETERLRIEAQHVRVEEAMNEVKHLVGVEEMLGQLYRSQQAHNQLFIRLANQLKPGTVGLFSQQKELAWLFKTDGHFYALITCNGEVKKMDWVREQYQAQPELSSETHLSLQITDNRTDGNAFLVKTCHNAEQINPSDPSWQQIVPLVYLMAHYQKLEFLKSLLLASQLKTGTDNPDPEHEKRLFWALKYMLHRPFSPHRVAYQGKERAAVHMLQVLATFLEVKMTEQGQSRLKIAYHCPEPPAETGPISFDGTHSEIIQHFLNQHWLFFGCHWPNNALPEANPDHVCWQSLGFIENNKRSVDLLAPLYQLALHELTPDNNSHPDKAVLQTVQIVRLKRHLQIQLICTGTLRLERIHTHQDAEVSGLSGALSRLAECLNVRGPEHLNQMPDGLEPLEHPLSICLNTETNPKSTHIVIQLRAPEWKGLAPTDKPEISPPAAARRNAETLPPLGQVAIYLANGFQKNDADRFSRVSNQFKNHSPQAFFEADLREFIQFLKTLQTAPAQNSGALLLLLHSSAWLQDKDKFWQAFSVIHPLWKKRLLVILYSGGSIDPKLVECLQNANIACVQFDLTHNLDHLGQSSYPHILTALQRHLSALEAIACIEPLAFEETGQNPFREALLHLKVLLEGYLTLAQQTPDSPDIQRENWFGASKTQHLLAPTAPAWFSQIDTVHLPQQVPHAETHQFFMALRDPDQHPLPESWTHTHFKTVLNQVESWLSKEWPVTHLELLTADFQTEKKKVKELLQSLFTLLQVALEILQGRDLNSNLAALIEQEKLLNIHSVLTPQNFFRFLANSDQISELYQQIQVISDQRLCHLFPGLPDGALLHLWRHLQGLTHQTENVLVNTEEWVVLLKAAYQELLELIA